MASDTVLREPSYLGMKSGYAYKREEIQHT